jgi:HSP20 family protein
MLQKYFLPFPYLEEDELALALPSASDLDVYEDEKSVVVAAPLPGLSPDEVDVTFHQGVLTIRGSKREEVEDKKRKYYRKANRTFTYRLTIPGTIDEHEEPKAEFKNGIMKVTFHKQKKAEPKRISIST